MCGIFGVLSKLKIDRQQFIKSLKTLQHRGPDNTRFWNDEQQTVFLGHTRLSIIDISERANQPMLSDDGRYIIVFNGEIYNFKEIKKELSDLGVSFNTNSDTEVLLKGYIIWQSEVLQRLNGMFAFVIWDHKEKILFGARDRLGQKPFYYLKTDKEFIFASEIKALLHYQKDITLNFESLSEYLHYGYFLCPNSFYNDIYQLPPASFFSLQNNQLKIEQYWNLSKLLSLHHELKVNQDELKEELDDLISDATQKRLISDVPLGAFLSGGLDSSTISEYIQKNNPEHRLRTFSIGFREDSFNELPFAEETAKYLNTNHDQEIVANNLETIFNELKTTFDQPFADTSSIPMLALTQKTRKNVTVALSGDGADEILGGYETYKADLLFKYYQWLPVSLKKVLYSFSTFLGSSHKKVSADYKIRQFLSAYSCDYKQAHMHWRQLFNKQEIRELLVPELHEKIDQSEIRNKIDNYYLEVHGLDRLNQNMYVDLKTWLLDDILVKVDRTSMRHSLEVRNPFLDYRVVELAMRIPPNFKINLFKNKIILKQIMNKRLPKKILKRKKAGFNAPLSHWIDENFTLNSGIYNTKFIEKLLYEHLSRRKDNSFRLFALKMLDLFFE